MTGSQEQSDKMGGNTSNDVEEGELPEEGEIMEEDEEQQQQTGKCTTMKMEDGEESGRTISSQQHHTPLNNKTESGNSSKDSRGSGGGSSWRRSLSNRGHSEHNIGAGKPHFSRASGRYRDHDSRATLKSEEAMMDSWVRGTHKNKGTRSPTSPHRSTGGNPNAEHPKQKPQKTEKATMSPAVDQHQKADNPSDNERTAKTEPTDGNNSTTDVTKTEAQPKQIISPVEDDKDYRVETPPAKELPEELKSVGLIEADDDNDFRRNSFGRFLEKRNFRVSAPQFPAQNVAAFSPNATLRQQQMDVQTMSAPPYECDDDYRPSPKRYRPMPFFDEENFPTDGGDDFRQHPHRFDQSFEQSPYEQHEGDFHEEHWSGGGRGRGGFHHFRGGRGGMHRPEWGGRPRWSGDGGPGTGKPFDRIICKFFREGFCRDGEKCTYSHATADSHRQPVLCRYYQQGFCRRNLFCQNLHGEWPCKAFHKGECTKEQCMFSHEPLDDVSRSILEKMLEDERRGITDGQNLEPQFQGGYYQRRKMFHQMREQHFHQQQGDQPQQYSEMAVHNFQSPRPNQQHFGGGHEVQNNDGTLSEFGGGSTHPSAQYQQHQKVQQQQQTQPMPQPTAFCGAHPMALAQHPTEPFGASVGGSTELPPPALVVPPILSVGATQPQTLTSESPSQQHNAVAVAAAFPPHPPASDGTSFGFFNRAAAPPPCTPSSSQVVPPTHQGPPQSVLTSPQQNFQQLQQQAQQTPNGPHFPHQPSLLGPSNISSPSLSAMVQQQFGTPAKNELFGDALQQISPTPPRPSPRREQIDTFNINQMLEQITQQTSDQFTTQTMEDPMDLLSKAVEESPASPPMFGSSSELGAVGSADDAKLIPMVREWRLYSVDIPTETESLPMNFDMKLIQQISSSNSDPRLRKLAEKQFDLVSKTFEKKQQQQSIIELDVEKVKKESTTTDNTTKTNGTDSTTVAKPKKEAATVDPRKDPRRKGRVTEQQHPSTSSSIDSPPAIAMPSMSVSVPFKMAPSSPSSVSASADTFSSHTNVVAPPENGNAQGPMRIQHTTHHQQDGTAGKTNRRTEGVGQSADGQLQRPFTSPVGGGGPFFGFHPHQQTPMPLVHQNMPSMDQSVSVAPPSRPPPFMGHLHPPPFGHQVHLSPVLGGGPFNVPPPVLSMPGGASVTSNAGLSLSQQLGSHAFNVGGFPSSSDSIGGPPRAHPSQFSNLREKRKNNEYESPLARIASSSGGAGGSGRRGARY